MKKKSFPLRIHPDILESMQKWANDDLRSINAQIEFVLRESLASSGRLDRSLTARRRTRKNAKTEADTPDSYMNTSPLTYRRVIGLAWPFILANVAVPLLGLVDTAVIGNLGSAQDLGAIAFGALIFSFCVLGFWLSPDGHNRICGAGCRRLRFS